MQEMIIFMNLFHSPGHVDLLNGGCYIEIAGTIQYPMQYFHLCFVIFILHSHQRAAHVILVS